MTAAVVQLLMLLIGSDDAPQRKSAAPIAAPVANVTTAGPNVAPNTIATASGRG